MQMLIAYVVKNLATWVAKVGAGFVAGFLMKYVRKWLKKEAKQRQKVRRRIAKRLTPSQVKTANIIRVHETAQRGGGRSAMLVPWTEKDFRLARLELYKKKFPKRWVTYMRNKIVVESDDARPGRKRKKDDIRKPWFQGGV